MPQVCCASGPLCLCKCWHDNLDVENDSGFLLQCSFACSSSLGHMDIGHLYHGRTISTFSLGQVVTSTGHSGLDITHEFESVLLLLHFHFVFFFFQHLIPLYFTLSSFRESDRVLTRAADSGLEDRGGHQKRLAGAKSSGGMSYRSSG